MRKNWEETPAYLHGSWEYAGRGPQFFRSPVSEMALFCAVDISVALIQVRPPGYFTNISITTLIVSALKNYYR
jgi:hypothetical protein